jgi:WD40 repeat protein
MFGSEAPDALIPSHLSHVQSGDGYRTVKLDYIQSPLAGSLGKVLIPSTTGTASLQRAYMVLDRSGCLHLCQLDGHELGQTSVLGSKSSALKGAKLAISPLGNSAAIFSDDGSVRFFELPSLTANQVVQTTERTATALTYRSDGKQIVCGDHSGRICTIDVDQHQVVKSFSCAKKGPVLAAAFPPTENSLLTVTQDKFIRTWDLSSTEKPKIERSIVRKTKGGVDLTDIKSASITPDASLIAVGAYIGVSGPGGGLPPTTSGNDMLARATSSQNNNNIGFSEEWFIDVFDGVGRHLYYVREAGMKNCDSGVSISPDGRLVSAQGPGGRLHVWPLVARGDAIDIPGCGTILDSQIGIVDGEFVVATVGNQPWITTVLRDTYSFHPTAQANTRGDSENNVEWTSPAEAFPVVNDKNLLVSAVVSGPSLKVGCKVDVATRKGADSNFDLTSTPRATSVNEATEFFGTATAEVIAPGRIQISQTVKLTEGPNRITLTLKSGTRELHMSKTVCYVPEAVAESPDPETVYSNSHALVIGINHYTNGIGPSTFQNLTGAIPDAEEFANLLEDSYGFKRENVVLLKDDDATKARIEQEMSRLASGEVVHTNDRVIVFFSGHGHSAENTEGRPVGFLIPFGVQKQINLSNFGALRQSCVSMAEIAARTVEIPAKHVMVILDSCFSGIATMEGDNYSPVYSLVHRAYFESKVVLAASGSDQESLERAGHGEFSRAMLEKLRHNETGCTATQLYESVKAALVQLDLKDIQTPKMGKFSAEPGEFLFYPLRKPTSLLTGIPTRN